MNQFAKKKYYSAIFDSTKSVFQKWQDLNQISLWNCICVKLYDRFLVN